MIEILNIRLKYISHKRATSYFIGSAPRLAVDELACAGFPPGAPHVRGFDAQPPKGWASFYMRSVDLEGISAPLDCKTKK